MTSKWAEQVVEAGNKTVNRKLRRAMRKAPPGTIVLIREEDRVDTTALSSRPKGGSAINPASGVKRG